MLFFVQLCSSWPDFNWQHVVWFLCVSWASYFLFCSLVSVVCCLLSSSVTHHGRPAGSFTWAGQVMMSCRLQSNYNFTVTLHGRPVVLRFVWATSCDMMDCCRTECWVVIDNLHVCECIGRVIPTVCWWIQGCRFLVA